MTKRIWTAVCGAMVGVATAGLPAQTAQTTAQTQTTPQQSSAASTEKITVTGCLKEAPGSSAASTAVGTTGTASTTGTAGTAGATPPPVPAATDAPKYVLADAVKSSADAAGATTTAGAAAPSASSAPQTYLLIANASALTPHVGKKLELVGTIDPNPASSDTASSSSGSSVPALRVESGKIVAASCTP
jgi:hypothetical protein